MVRKAQRQQEYEAAGYTVSTLQSREVNGWLFFFFLYIVEFQARDAATHRPGLPASINLS